MGQAVSVTLSCKNTDPSKLIRDLGVILCLQQFLPSKVGLEAPVWSSLPLLRARGEEFLPSSMKGVPCRLKISVTAR